MKGIAKREHIPVGRQNAITRAELAALWGISDREVRETIAHMRTAETDDAYAILSSSTAPSGYWRSNDKAELVRYMREQQARARNTLKNMADARRVINNG